VTGNWRSRAIRRYDAGVSALLRPRVVALLVALGVAVAAAPPARAQSAAFDDAWNKGNDAFSLAKYDEARAAFEKARDLDPKSPGPWRYLGRIAKIQSRWDDCVRATTESIRLKPDQKFAPEVRADLDECRKQLGRPAFAGTIPENQGAIAVIANVEGASVKVGGIKKGATPLDPFAVNPGKTTVLVERRGYFPVEVQVDVVPGLVVDVDPNAKPDERPPEGNQLQDVKVGWVVVAVGAKDAAITIDGKPAATKDDGSIELDPGDHVVEITAPGYEPWRRRVKWARGQKRTVTAHMQASGEVHSAKTIAAWSFGVAVVAGLGGGVFGLLENAPYEKARDAYEIEQQRPKMGTVSPTVPEGHVTTRAEYEDMKSRAQTYGLISNVSFGVAAVALGVSIYYFAKARPSERPGYPMPRAKAPAVTPTVLVGAGGHGLGLSLSKEWRW
jgi:tetratricopeptide (TPR) repeat protein